MVVVRTGGWVVAVVEVEGEPAVLLVLVEVSGEATTCVGEGGVKRGVEGGGEVDSKDLRGFRSRGW